MLVVFPSLMLTMGYDCFFSFVFWRNPFEARRRRKNFRRKNCITQEEKIIKRGNCQKIMIYSRFSNLFLLLIALSFVLQTLVLFGEEIKKEE